MHLGSVALTANERVPGSLVARAITDGTQTQHWCGMVLVDSRFFGFPVHFPKGYRGLPLMEASDARLADDVFGDARATSRDQ